MALPEHTKGEESFPVRDTWCQMQGVELKHQALGNRLSGGAAVADRLCLECFEAVLDRRGSLIRPTQPTRGTSIFYRYSARSFWLPINAGRCLRTAAVRQMLLEYKQGRLCADYQRKHQRPPISQGFNHWLS